jgi:hypothetical protein
MCGDSKVVELGQTGSEREHDELGAVSGVELGHPPD